MWLNRKKKDKKVDVAIIFGCLQRDGTRTRWASHAFRSVSSEVGSHKDLLTFTCMYVCTYNNDNLEPGLEVVGSS